MRRVVDALQSFYQPKIFRGREQGGDGFSVSLKVLTFLGLIFVRSIKGRIYQLLHIRDASKRLQPQNKGFHLCADTGLSPARNGYLLAAAGGKPMNIYTSGHPICPNIEPFTCAVCIYPVV